MSSRAAQHSVLRISGLTVVCLAQWETSIYVIEYDCMRQKSSGVPETGSGYDTKRTRGGCLELRYNLKYCFK